MDLDLAQVRAFTAVAEHRHFGRAAAELNLTQQALSKRIQRLEVQIGEMLLERSPGRVALTDAGKRFLPYAAQALAAADAAVTAARQIRRPVRVDAWGQPHPPLQRLAELMAAAPEISIEISTRRNLPLALSSLQRGELDLAFGRPHDLCQPWPAELSRRLVDLSRAGVLISGRSPLIDCTEVRRRDLAGHRVWAPTAGTSPEFMGWWRRAAEFLGLELETDGHNMGIAQAVADINRDPARVALLPANFMLTEDPAVAALRPLTDPAMLLAWSLIWRTTEHSRPVMQIVQRLSELSRQRRWTAFRLGLDWLPEPDRADLTEAS